MIGKGFLTGIIIGVLMSGCGSKPRVVQETPTTGTIHISVDESFKPVIDSQIKVFNSTWPDAHIIVDYRPEAQCLRDLTTDTTRMILVTRGLTPEEENFYNDSFHVRPTYGVLAYDAIAVIVNPANKDTTFDMKDIVNMLNGTDTRFQPVMDGVSATSTVRYAIDSILQGKPLGKNVTAARNSEDVVNYVANNPRAVGFVGVLWVGDRNDPADTSFNKRIKVAAIQCKNCVAGKYVGPYQANIAWGRYPLVRSLYYVLKEGFSGIGSNFQNFLQYERGQLIFSKAYMWPAGMHFEIRDVNINQ
jgi:phosphate transport system substrate-binding protein